MSRYTVPQCTGECCQSFCVGNYTLKRFKAEASEIEDGEYIAAMLISTPTPKGETGHRFNCKHFDTKTNRCGAYAARPRMCKEFPSAGKCERCGAPRVKITQNAR
jgi:Fe-S-cluster containining protein